MKTLHYISMDAYSRPVYEDRESGKLYKDTDPRSHVPPSLFTVMGNTFEGEPELPLLEKVKFVPKRKTW